MSLISKTRTFFSNPWTLGLKLVERSYWLWSDATYLRLYYFFSMHKTLSLKNPETFSEKLQWLKLYNRREEYSLMVDKNTVKDYVASIIGHEYINPTIEIYDSVESMCLENLPQKFVIKTTHGGGSSGVFICKDKQQLDISKLKSNLVHAMSQDSFRKFKEWPYKNVQKKILVERYIEHEGDLVDYKFFCFNGRAEYCQVITGREKDMCVDFFDRSWKHQDFHEPAEYPFSSSPLICPNNYQKMIELAESLAVNMPFVRIDFYDVDDKIIFGEITFYPTAGFGRFQPEDWNKKLGDMIQLPSMQC